MNTQSDERRARTTGNGADATAKARGPSSVLPIETDDAARESGKEKESGDYKRIEQVAARTGLTKRTLRYYEEIGLLPAPTRTEGGYRLYSAQDVEHLERIKRLRDLLGFSLAELREIAELEEYREQARAEWDRDEDPVTRLNVLDRAEALTQRHLGMVDEKLAGLQEMRNALVARLDKYRLRRDELKARLAQKDT